MNSTFNILAIGDVVGKPGRKICRRKIEDLRHEHAVDFVIVNGENAAGGMSITPDATRELLDSGADVITTGNHVWASKEIEEYIDIEPRLLRPANYPPGVRGNGFGIFEVFTRKICVINLMGRIGMEPLDCPFRKFDHIYKTVQDHADIIIVDFHAETTSEKRALGWYLAGRASAVYGTHTHVQTSDEEVLPGGTAYITDLGMTGSFNSVIGMDIDISLQRFLTASRRRFTVATGNVKLNGAVFYLNDEGRAVDVRRLSVPD